MKKQLFLGLGLAAAVTASAQLNEDFNGTTGTGLPTGWTQTSSATDGGFLTGTSADLSSTYWTFAAGTNRFVATNDDDCNCNKANERLVSPAFTVPTPGANENVFMKYDYAFNEYQGSEAKVQISTDGGTTWVDLTPNGLAETAITNGEIVMSTDSVDLNNYAGQSVQIGFFYNDQGGWEYGLAVDNISTYAIAKSTDLASQMTRVYETYGVNQAVTLNTRFLNEGSEAVDSFDFKYSVNGVVSAAEPVAITGFTTGMITNYIDHTTTWTPTTTGTYTIKMWAENLNGGADDNNTNDTTTITVNVVDSTAVRVALAEMFSSNTCGPCAGFNGATAAMFASKNPNTAGSNYAIVKYQQTFPSPGTDPSANNDANARRNFYGISGIPGQRFNGVDAANYNFNFVAQTWADASTNVSAQFDYEQGRPATAMVMGTATFVDSSAFTADKYSIDINVTATPYLSGSNATLYVALTNKGYYFSGGSNGETDFKHIMRAMYPSAAGTAVASYTSGTPVSVNFTDVLNVGTVAQNSKTLWNDTIEVVAWMQDNASGRILNAGIIPVTKSVAQVTSTTEALQAVNAVRVYPNPVVDFATVEFNMAKSADVTVEVSSISGAILSAQQITAAQGQQTAQINTAELATGVYFVNVKSEGKVISTKINVIK